MVPHTPVKSSSLASVAHDPATNVLEVRFNSGALYAYEGFTAEDYAQLLGAESIGKHFHAAIKNGGFKATKVA
jgi:hypothetical protein